MPLLGRQPEIYNFVSKYASSPSLKDKVPKAILVVTAHWIYDKVMVSSGSRHPLLFDYGGFPHESYSYQYNAPGSPEVAREVCKLLQAANIPCQTDSSRGWDHGVFVPLMMLYPQANIPVVAMSLHSSLDPDYHIQIGRALAPLRDQGVFILGSGASFHNFEYYFTNDAKKRKEGHRHSHVFNNYLLDTLTSGKFTTTEQIDRLRNIKSAPSAAACNKPREEEHLIPLHVVAGAALAREEEGSKPRGRSIGHKYEDNDFAVANIEWL